MRYRSVAGMVLSSLLLVLPGLATGEAPGTEGCADRLQGGAGRVSRAAVVPASQIVVFDFDNAPARVSLPLDLTVNGVAVHLSVAGFYGYSIQFANVLGFTPAGFAGMCVYPNTVYASDLVFDFDHLLTDFSIMYAPEEYGGDYSATVRANAYLNGVYVGTNTAVASQPGTWPTGTLTYSDIQGFNRVVVHYDAPPVCGDWGPIFMADNMIVTLISQTGVTDPGPAATMAPLASPNPFALQTTIRFGVERTGAVSLVVYDLSGRLIRTLMDRVDVEAGIRMVNWDGRDDGGRPVVSGVYLCRVVTDGVSRTAGLVLVGGR